MDLFAAQPSPPPEYTLVSATGVFAHDRSVFVGPRMRDAPGGAVSPYGRDRGYFFAIQDFFLGAVSSFIGVVATPCLMIDLKPACTTPMLCSI